MVLVTGGTGLVGSHLLLKLSMDHEKIRALYRSKDKLAQVKKIFSYYSDNSTTLFNRIDWVQGDILDIPSLENALKNITHVYHCAAYISFNPSDFKKLERINREGTANIVNICIAEGIKKLCHVSTIGTIGRTLNGEQADEETEWIRQNTNPYAITKQLAELEVWRGAQENLEVVIVNPGVILGPGFWNSGSGSFFTTAAKGYNYYPPGGSGFVTINDVTNIMIALMNSDIYNERFILVAKNLTYEQILKKIALAMDKKPPTKALKFWQLKIGKIADIIKNILTGSPRTITKNTIYGLKHPTTFNNEKIKNTLGMEFDSLDEQIKFSSKLFISEHS
ncbi:NAD-dependent epimerase/dehydratase family protein [Maribacter ulvicola]|uniref:Nucleoside-diphosphate-sugar epimerase n=1 Tax=Maribacter ulvicola TaxID=228959 RepID=A0A1N6NQT0_9FLAO|nr:NAD-dependent epimerase/dehydratase family protein [Maribacter ulvicola]SIP94434.1 Nucleoside-diphosphate-sugar epimerase [Maribacter ulvicola]